MTPKNPLTYFDGTDFKHELVTPGGLNLIKIAMEKCRREYAIELLSSPHAELISVGNIEDILNKFELELK